MSRDSSENEDEEEEMVNVIGFRRPVTSKGPRESPQRARKRVRKPTPSLAKGLRAPKRPLMERELPMEPAVFQKLIDLEWHHKRTGIAIPHKRDQCLVLRPPTRGKIYCRACESFVSRKTLTQHVSGQRHEEKVRHVQEYGYGRQSESSETRLEQLVAGDMAEIARGTVNQQRKETLAQSKKKLEVQIEDRKKYMDHLRTRCLFWEQPEGDPARASVIRQKIKFLEDEVDRMFGAVMELEEKVPLQGGDEDDFEDAAQPVAPC